MIEYLAKIQLFEYLKNEGTKKSKYLNEFLSNAYY